MTAPTPREALATELLDAIYDYLNAIKGTFVIFEPAEDRLRKAYNAVVQEAALTRREPLDVERLARAIDDHHDICSRMAIPECADRIAAEYARLEAADA